MNQINLSKINRYNYKVMINGITVGILSEKKLLNLLGNLTVTEIDDVQKDVLLNKIKQTALEKFLKYLAYRDRSTKEAKFYLEKMLLAPNIATELLEYAKRYNFLNDERFCENYISSLYENGKSKNFIRYKLNEKGIDEHTIDKMLSKIYVDEDERLDKIILSVIKKYKDNKPEKIFEKTLTYLVRNGFEYHQVRDRVWQMINKG